MVIAKLKNVVKIYGKHENTKVVAIDNVSIEIKKGEFLAIAGPSGSGKTTLLNLIGGLDRPTSGEIIVEGQSFSKLNRSEIAEYRLNNLGFIFQAFNLIPVLTAEENVEFPLILKGVKKEDRKIAVQKELQELGIKRSMFKRLPNELSSGQQQRVSVARATVSLPKIILADEPTANLDSETGYNLISQMKEMNNKKGITFIFSTHDQMLLRNAQRLILVRDGRIIEDRA